LPRFTCRRGSLRLAILASLRFLSCVKRVQFVEGLAEVSAILT